MKTNIIVSKDIIELTDNFLKIIEKTLLEVKNRKITMALSGGSTPKRIFECILEKNSDSIDWSRILYFWGDERCVPPEDEQSNFRMANESFLKPLNISHDNIFRMRGESDPIIETERYQQLLKDKITIKESEIPVFDIMLIGLGEDGHTASIFPDQIELFNSDNFCETAFHPETKQRRITITGKVINHSSKIIFIVTGKSKANVVKDILTGSENRNLYPASFVNAENGKLFWLLDKDSASLL